METIYRLVTSLPDKLFGGALGAFAERHRGHPGPVQAVLRGRGSGPAGWRGSIPTGTSRVSG